MDKRVLILGIIMLMGLPMLGVVLAGHPVGWYLEFPPRPAYVRHAGFSWPAFVLIAAVFLAVALPFEWRVFRSRRGIGMDIQPERAFPRWGWTGVALGVISWTLAWTRFEWFAPFQVFVFTPLWVSYVIVVNALTFRRTASCMITDRPVYLLELFLLSAAFWWFFEYLNRFVLNWYYLGTGAQSAMGYFWRATLPFSTVLPAVLGTYELLVSFPRCGAGLDAFVKIDAGRTRLPAWIVLLASSAGLMGLGIWPDYLFPLLWLSPLLLIVSLQSIAGDRTLFAGIRSGNWRRVYILALSALVCGFFWEFWNCFSCAKWVYNIPFVGRFKLFEMPVLGFIGYLPFGLECAVIADAILLPSPKR